jgi:hypothetical protein
MKPANIKTLELSLLRNLPKTFMDRGSTPEQNASLVLLDFNHEITRSWAFLFGFSGDPKKRGDVYDQYTPLIQDIPEVLRRYLRGYHIGQSLENSFDSSLYDHVSTASSNKQPIPTPNSLSSRTSFDNFVTIWTANNLADSVNSGKTTAIPSTTILSGVSFSLVDLV